MPWKQFHGQKYKYILYAEIVSRWKKKKTLDVVTKIIFAAFFNLNNIENVISPQ